MTGPPDDVPKSPWKFNVTEGAGNQVEQMRKRPPTRSPFWRAVMLQARLSIELFDEQLR
jgi:hypothetical protein